MLVPGINGGVGLSLFVANNGPAFSKLALSVQDARELGIALVKMTNALDRLDGAK